MPEFTEHMLVTCQPNGNMEHVFTGQIKKLYENSALVDIVNYHPKDALNVRELQYMAVIAYKRMRSGAVDVAVSDAVG
ncbi:hypothetical protein [Lacticaseibacillus jixiensis]|uniref:hypothetical protein n=1 Tax=Lacticaseibacillus jixiensis TaxID=3231926 RepID=UPI0036F2409C